MSWGAFWGFYGLIFWVILRRSGLGLGSGFPIGPCGIASRGDWLDAGATPTPRVAPGRVTGKGAGLRWGGAIDGRGLL